MYKKKNIWNIKELRVLNYTKHRACLSIYSEKLWHTVRRKYTCKNNKRGMPKQHMMTFHYFTFIWNPCFYIKEILILNNTYFQPQIAFRFVFRIQAVRLRIAIFFVKKIMFEVALSQVKTSKSMSTIWTLSIRKVLKGVLSPHVVGQRKSVWW